MAKPLPKSLHTVTVLVNVARRYMECERYPIADAVEKALEDLGYSADADPYGLAQAAKRALDIAAGRKGYDL